MNAVMNRFLCALLALVVAALPMQPAMAGMIGTEHAVAAAQPAYELERVTQFISRPDVQAQLERLGVSPVDAADRAGLLSEAELQRLAGQIDNAPAGAVGTLLVIVLLGILVWALVLR
jgi:hypothetical protein